MLRSRWTALCMAFVVGLCALTIVLCGCGGSSSRTSPYYTVGKGNVELDISRLLTSLDLKGESEDPIYKLDAGLYPTESTDSTTALYSKSFDVYKGETTKVMEDIPDDVHYDVRVKLCDTAGNVLINGITRDLAIRAKSTVTASLVKYTPGVDPSPTPEPSSSLTVDLSGLGDTALAESVESVHLYVCQKDGTVILDKQMDIDDLSDNSYQVVVKDTPACAASAVAFCTDTAESALYSVGEATFAIAEGTKNMVDLTFSDIDQEKPLESLSALFALAVEVEDLGVFGSSGTMVLNLTDESGAPTVAVCNLVLCHGVNDDYLLRISADATTWDCDDPGVFDISGNKLTCKGLSSGCAVTGTTTVCGLSVNAYCGAMVIE